MADKGYSIPGGDKTERKGNKSEARSLWLFSYICSSSIHTTMAETIHQGRNIKRFREMLGLKQEALALELGEDWNQKKVSLLESKEVVEDGLLEEVARVLRVPKEAIKNFDEEKAVTIISNTFNDDSTAFSNYYKCTVNPLEKYIEQVEKNEKLYERLVQVEREKNELLQRLLHERQ